MNIIKNLFFAAVTVATIACAPVLADISACCIGGNCCASGKCCTMAGCCKADKSCCDPAKGACTSACGCLTMKCCPTDSAAKKAVSSKSGTRIAVAGKPAVAKAAK